MGVLDMEPELTLHKASTFLTTIAVGYRQGKYPSKYIITIVTIILSLEGGPFTSASVNIGTLEFNCANLFIPILNIWVFLEGERKYLKKSC